MSTQHPAVEPVEEFQPPYSPTTLRVLQGIACRDCQTMTGPLHLAGQAVTVTGEQRITWNLRRCVTCKEARDAHR